MCLGDISYICAQVQKIPSGLSLLRPISKYSFVNRFETPT